MRCSDHLHHGSRRCKDENSSDERGCSRVPRKTVRSSLITQKSSCCSKYEYVKSLHLSKSRGDVSLEVSVGDGATIAAPVTDHAERTFERIIGKSTALE